MASRYKQPRKWALIGLIMALAPLPVIGVILYAYSLLPKTMLFYIFLPFVFIISMSVYIMLMILISVIVYKAHAPLKEGLFDINSKETESWLAAQAVLKAINLVQTFQVPSNLLKGFYSRIFKTKLGDIFILGGAVEHSLVDVGNHVVIGQNSIITGHAIEDDHIYIKKIKIGNNVTIGAETMVMPGVEIGEGTIVGACSLVTKDKKLEPYSLYLGVPVKKIKDLPHKK